jgi:hypothetical protein
MPDDNINIEPRGSTRHNLAPGTTHISVVHIAGLNVRSCNCPPVIEASRAIGWTASALAPAIARVLIPSAFPPQIATRMIDRIHLISCAAIPKKWERPRRFASCFISLR